MDYSPDQLAEIASTMASLGWARVRVKQRGKRPRICDEEDCGAVFNQGDTAYRREFACVSGGVKVLTLCVGCANTLAASELDG